MLDVLSGILLTGLFFGLLTIYVQPPPQSSSSSTLIQDSVVEVFQVCDKPFSLSERSHSSSTKQSVEDISGDGDDQVSESEEKGVLSESGSVEKRDLSESGSVRAESPDTVAASAESVGSRRSVGVKMSEGLLCLESLKTRAPGMIGEIQLTPISALGRVRESSGSDSTDGRDVHSVGSVGLRGRMQSFAVEKNDDGMRRVRSRWSIGRKKGGKDVDAPIEGMGVWKRVKKRVSRIGRSRTNSVLV